jgi:hypothetical protein
MLYLQKGLIFVIFLWLRKIVQSSATVLRQATLIMLGNVGSEQCALQCSVCNVSYLITNVIFLVQGTSNPAVIDTSFPVSPIIIRPGKINCHLIYHMTVQSAG